MSSPILAIERSPRKNANWLTRSRGGRGAGENSFAVLVFSAAPREKKRRDFETERASKNGPLIVILSASDESKGTFALEEAQRESNCILRVARNDNGHSANAPFRSQETRI